jgi:hypothetical protein
VGRLSVGLRLMLGYFYTGLIFCMTLPQYFFMMALSGLAQVADDWL